MPALSTEVTNFLTAVTDKLSYGQHAGTRASAIIGSGANGTVTLQALNGGPSINSYTVVVALSGTVPLSVSVAGTIITVTLAATAGVGIPVSNTAKKVAAALNANLTFAKTFSATASGLGTAPLTIAEASKSFTGGGTQEDGYPNAGINYLRAQDMATVLELLEDAISKTTAITATAGSTTTATIAAAGAANTLKGAVVTFGAATTTVLLRGVTATVASNTTTVLTFTSTLPAAVAVGDTFTLRQTILDGAIDVLRGADRGLGDAPASPVYGLSRTVLDALQRLEQQLGTSLTDPTISGAALKTGTGSTTSNIVTNQTKLRIDEFKNYALTISGVTRTILGNNESTIFLNSGLVAAPAANVAITVSFPAAQPTPNNFGGVHSGVQPGDNARLASFITAAKTTVTAYTLPA